MEQSSRAEDLVNLISEDLRFHHAICELSGHGKLLQVWSTLENQLRVFLTIETSHQYVITHHPVMDAIKQGDTQLAQQMIREHLDSGMQMIKEGYWRKSSKRKKILKGN